MIAVPQNPNDWGGAVGSFVMHYAAVEVEFKIFLGVLMDLSIYEVSVLAEPYTTQSLRNTFKSAVTLKLPPDDPNREVLIQFMGRFKEFSSIRNHLAHSKWVAGTRPRSYKPIYVTTRDGKAKFIGTSTSEPDYTSAELIKQARKLAALLNDLLVFKVQSGYNEIIERNMDRERY